MSLKPGNVDFESTWRNIHSTIEHIITRGGLDQNTWHNRFSDVYKVCTIKPFPDGGKKLHNETESFLMKHVKDLLKKIQTSGETNILELYHQHWQNYKTGTTHVNKLYAYLNYSYIKKLKLHAPNLVATPRRLSIGELAKNLWKKLLIDPLKDKLVDLLLQEIKKDRNGHNTNEAMIHSIVTSFVDVSEYEKIISLKLYQEYFEGIFLKETGEFYSKRATHLKEKCTCSEYLTKAIELRESEDHRSKKFLYHTSYNKVSKEVQMKIVQEMLEYLKEESTQMVEQERTADLKNLFNLLRKPVTIKEGLVDLSKKLKNHIRKKGEEAVSGLEEKPLEYVEALLTVHKKFKDMISTCFDDYRLFRSALEDACIGVINDERNGGQSKSPELLVNYCDKLLKKNSNVGDAEFEEKLSGIIIIFKYLDSKDIFQKFYSEKLARRLIKNDKSASHYEKSVITRLKDTVGDQYTSDFEVMINDVELSKDLMKSFAASHGKALDVNFNILVLNKNAWPRFPDMTFHLPQELESSFKSFEIFFRKKRKGRNLILEHNYDTVAVNLSYLGKQYTVSMSVYQLACLLPFEMSDSLDFSSIKASTGLPDRELIKLLNSLVKAKIILSSASISRHSTFKLNLKYSEERINFSIVATFQKKSPSEIAMTKTTVEKHRKVPIEAAIMHIMKSKKKIKHNDLIQEVFSHVCRFRPSIPMIKKSVESLIEREFLERVTGRTDEYSYIA